MFANRMCNDEQDLVLEYSIAELPADLKYIGVSFGDFNIFLKRIRSNIENRNRMFKISKPFLEDIVELHDIALALYEKVNKQKMNNFLYSSWISYSEHERKEYIKLLFTVMDYKRVSKSFVNSDNCFWFNADPKGRHKFLIVCLEEMDFRGLNKFVNQLKVKKFLDSVIVVAEDEETSKAYENGLNEIDSDHIVIEFLYKNELQRIFNNINKLNELDIILQEKMIAWD